jgi:hypothetical protein
MAVGRVELFIYSSYLSVLSYYLMSMSRRGDGDEIYTSTVLLDILAYACMHGNCFFSAGKKNIAIVITR